MKIPFMRIDRQFAQIRAEVMPKVMAVLESGRVLQSAEIEGLERRLAELHGLGECVAVNSGTDALTLAIAALELPEGSPVAVPAMTFIASAAAIVHNRCRPIFIDVDPETMLMDLAQLNELIEKRSVRAVVAVHLYGQLLDLEETARLASARDVPLIEDAAQAIGSTRLGKPPGAYGRATCLSFDPTKVIGACGSGGAIVTSDPVVAKTGRRLRYHGHAGNRVYDRIGYNCQMDSLQAAIIDVKLDHSAAWQERRTAIAGAYRRGLEACDGITPVTTLAGNTHNYHKFVLRVRERDALARHLGERGVQTSIHYSLPLHRQPCFAEYAGGVNLPKVEAVTPELLSLPMYAELTDEEVEHVVKSVVEFAGTAR